MKNSAIEWTHHTFNPWHGCMKVSEGCKHCYAEGQDKRWGGHHWGPNSERKAMSQKYWQQPIKWNKEAKEAGERHRVFCASMADVFEGTDTCTNEVAYRHIRKERARLFSLIKDTPQLDWLLLTKRPQNILPILLEIVSDSEDISLKDWIGCWQVGAAPVNVWLGTSVENQDAADKRIPELLKVPAFLRFLSMEPLLGAVNIDEYISRAGHVIASAHHRRTGHDCGYIGNCFLCGDCESDVYKARIEWVIVGGESGPSARPMHPHWVMALRDQCASASAPFLFKQWGEYIPASQAFHPVQLEEGETYRLELKWQDAQTIQLDTELFLRVGKKAAGRRLSSLIHNEFPFDA